MNSLLKIFHRNVTVLVEVKSHPAILDEHLHVLVVMVDIVCHLVLVL